MRLLRLALAAVSLVALTATASPTDPKNGVEYTTLEAPQRVDPASKKVEVIEFFMYHCPHCNALEPTMAEWVKKQGDKISFRRVHFPVRGASDPHSHLYLTLEAMGKVDSLHDKIFRAYHVERNRLASDEAVLDFVVKNGIDKTKFLEAWNSFSVQTKMKRAAALLASYKIDSAPTIVIDGRYVTSPATASAGTPAKTEVASHQAAVQVMDALVAKVIKDKAASIKPAAKSASK
jgi:protein dithiol oxidoreductase (disulfide-forming)